METESVKGTMKKELIATAIIFLAVGFLAFFWWIVNREYGCRTAGIAALILGTTVGWMALGQAGVTDLPLAATFSAAMMLALPWIAKGDTRYLPASAALLGLAVLAKGPAPLILALPLVLRGKQMRDLIRWRVVIPFVVVAVPWYVLCYVRNGTAFIKEFLLKQNLERYTSSEVIQHGHPWWYFVPVLAVGLLPWLPLLPAAAIHRSGLSDLRKKFLAAWVVWIFLFFSISANKLPAYILPMFPAAALLMALALDSMPKAAPWLVACALLTVLYPIAVPLLPSALEFGLTHAARPSFDISWLYPVFLALLAWIAESRARRLAAVVCVAGGVAVGAANLKSTAASALEATPSPRALWQKVKSHADEVCLDHVQRNWAYGLNYYAQTALPDCAEHPTPWQVRQEPGRAPWLAVPEFSPRTMPPMVPRAQPDR